MNSAADPAAGLLTFALVAFAAAGLCAFRLPARRRLQPAADATQEGQTGDETPGANSDDCADSTSHDHRLLPWMLAAPGVWLVAAWAAEVQSLSARGVAAGLLISAFAGAASLGLARRLRETG